MAEPGFKKTFYPDVRELILVSLAAFIILLVAGFFWRIWYQDAKKAQTVIDELMSGKTVRLRQELERLSTDNKLLAQKWAAEQNRLYVSRDLAALTTLDVAGDWHRLLMSLPFTLIQENPDTYFQVASSPPKYLGKGSRFSALPVTTSLHITFNELLMLLDRWPREAASLWRLQELFIQRDEAAMPYHRVRLVLNRLGYRE